MLEKFGKVVPLCRFCFIGWQMICFFHSRKLSGMELKHMQADECSLTFLTHGGSKASKLFCK